MRENHDFLPKWFEIRTFDTKCLKTNVQRLLFENPSKSPSGAPTQPSPFQFYMSVYGGDIKNKSVFLFDLGDGVYVFLEEAQSFDPEKNNFHIRRPMIKAQFEEFKTIDANRRSLAARY